MAGVGYARIDSDSQNDNFGFDDLPPKPSSRYKIPLTSVWFQVCAGFLAGVLIASVAWKISQVAHKGDLEFLSKYKKREKSSQHIRS